MIRKLAVLTMLLSIFSSCDEDPISTQNTAANINFAFFVDGKARKPDSVSTDFGQRIFSDSLQFYTLSLPVDTLAFYQFYIDSLTSQVLLKYTLEREKDVDRVVYKAYNPIAAATNIDSLIITCTDTVTCKTNEAVINLYF